MKNAIFAVALLFVSVTANAAQVKSATYNAYEDLIELEVQYSGGCHEHQFTLELGGCAESYPAQIHAKLIDQSEVDACDAIMFRKVTFPASVLDQCRPAYVTIEGDGKTQATAFVHQ